MKRIISALLAVSMMIISLPSVALGEGNNTPQIAERTKAFPTAEGGGMYTKGARAAFDSGDDIEVYHVTNLNDSGEGSFRDAVSKGNRIVVFDVSGMIDLKTNVTISKPNMTMLGQTAPGDGICFRGDNVKIGADNVILRYLRFRVGAKHADGTVTPARDGLEITDNVQDAIVDHCSVSWGTDENLSAYAVKNVTIQWSVIAEALNQSVHDKGEHSYGAIWGGVNLSVHHNIIASHKSRNPKIGTSETVTMTEGYTDKETVVDIRNNVIYNWGDKAGYGAENGANVNIVNNYYKPGPSTPEEKRARIFELSPGNKYKPNWSGCVYANGNYIDYDSADATAVNTNNWQIERKTGVYLDTKNPSYEKLDAPKDTYLNDYPVNTTDAMTAYEEVMSSAGARVPKLDSVDRRIIDNVQNGTAPNGSKGSVGLIDDPSDAIPTGDEDMYDESGYPVWTREIRGADYDTDSDGIPDEAEDIMGLNKDNPTDSLFIGPMGYTYLELFAEKGLSTEFGGIALNVENNKAKISSDISGDYDIYVDDKKVKTVNIQGGVADGSTLVTAVYKSDGTLAEALTEKYNGGGINFPVSEKEGTVKHFIWDSLEGMKPLDNAASVETTLDTTRGVHSVTVMSADSARCSNTAYMVCQQGDREPAKVQGNFTVVARLNQIPTLTTNSYAAFEVRDADGTGAVTLLAGCDEGYNKVIKLSGTSVPMGKATMIKAERRGNTLKFYSGTSLFDWTQIGAVDTVGQEKEFACYDVYPEGKTSAANVDYSVITETTTPQIFINDIEDNRRLNFEERINVNVRADNAPVREIRVSLNGNVIASKPVDISGEETVAIPVSFAEAQKGRLTVSCVDANLCTAETEVNVTVSADIKPWQIADIGVGDNETKTYISSSDDYTYKINGPDGGIGGSGDKCGYMYNLFTENSRIYARLRINGGKQNGFMLRSGLNEDSVAYFIGCDTASGSRVYKIMGRNTEGGEMTTLQTLDTSSDKIFLVVEKSGDKINVYETEASPTIYTTRTLLYTIENSNLGDEYYMGFAAVMTEGASAPDVGWTGIEAFSEKPDSHIWNFNSGLDWCWQMQERNMLSPQWTDEAVNGMTDGKILIIPDESYTDNRYIFREYTMSDELCPQMTAKVMLTGEKPAMNLYFQTGNSKTAYKVTFMNDGEIYDGLGNEIGNWSVNEAYGVSMSTDIDADALEMKCALNITDNQGESVASANIPLDESFRTQINTEKKTPVTKAVYLEPVSTGDGKYYVDDLSLWGEDASVKVIKTDSWYTFNNITSITGAFTVNGTKTINGSEESGEVMSVAAGAELKTGNKSAEGMSFTNRIRIKNNNGKITLPVKNGSVITVYGASANSTATRALFINGQKYDILTACASTYTYTGEDGNIEIYGGDNIEIYGINVSTRSVTE